MSDKKDKESQKIQVLELLSKAFGIPQVGITLEVDMGNKPYINSLGLEYAHLKYPTAVTITEISLGKVYEKIGDTAIAIVKGYYGNQENQRDFRLDVGTAGAANLNLVKNYPNEMAITRAVNRFLRRGLLPHLYRDLEANLAKLDASERTIIAPYLTEFGRVSSEELVEIGESQQEPEVFLTNEEMTQIKPLLEAILASETEDELNQVGQQIKEEKANLNEKQMNKLRQIFADVKKEKEWI